MSSEGANDLLSQQYSSWTFLTTIWGHSPQGYVLSFSMTSLISCLIVSLSGAAKASDLTTTALLHGCCHLVLFGLPVYWWAIAHHISRLVWSLCSLTYCKGNTFYLNNSGYKVVFLYLCISNKKRTTTYMGLSPLYYHYKLLKQNLWKLQFWKGPVWPEARKPLLAVALVS